jgi:hypothetical protein
MVVVGHQRPYGRVSTLPFSFLMENIMRVDFANERFISLEDAGLEESSDLPVFGLQEAESSRHGIYSYMDWFYDADDSAFSIL